MNECKDNPSFDQDEAVALPSSFFDRPVPDVAADLLGCVIVSSAEGACTAGRIIETEAYLGVGDPGSHAATVGVTKRNAVMYGAAGTAYVYFTYGNHHMLNLVCGPKGVAGAVLIRALAPVRGLETMSSRRGGRPMTELCNGPGKLAAALGVDMRDNGVALGMGRLAVYDGERPHPGEVAATGRIGLSEGHELELRYYVKDCPFVSRGKTGPRSGTHHRAAKRRKPT